VKLPADGSIERYKVLLVAKECKQRYDLDNDGTFSHVIKPATIGYCFLRVFLTDGIFISLTFKMHFYIVLWMRRYICVNLLVLLILIRLVTIASLSSQYID
jgi:hypothetical protein